MRPRPARQVVLRPGPHFQRLRPHAVALRRERGPYIQIALFRCARAGHGLALRRFRAFLARQALPFQARALHAKVIRDLQIEGHHLRLQHHLLLRIPTRQHARRIVFHGLHLQCQRVARRQPVRILPGEDVLRVFIHRHRNRHHVAFFNRLRLAIHRSGCQIATRGEFKRGLRALHQAHGATARLNDWLRAVLQVLRQRQPRLQGLQFRPLRRHQVNRLAHIAHPQVQRRIELLRRQREIIAVRRQPGFHRGLILNLHRARLWRPLRVLAQRGLQVHRLRVGHDQPLRQLLHLRKRVALHVLPGREPACHRIPGRRGHHEERQHRHRHRRSRRPAPGPVLILRHRFIERNVLHRLRRLRHRRLHQPLAASGAEVHPRQFHDAQQLVAQARHLLAQQARRILQPALLPHPTMPFQRQPQAQHRRTGEQQQPAHPARRVKQTVQREHQRVAHGQAEHRRQQAFQKLDDPHPASKIRELGLKRRREGKRGAFVHSKQLRRKSSGCAAKRPRESVRKGTL